EPEESQYLRPRVVGLVSGVGEDKDLIAQAKTLTQSWLADPKNLDDDSVDIVLTIAARHGDKALFDQLHQALKKSSDRRERRRFLRTLSSFQDTALLKEALSLLLTDEIEARESFGLLFGGAFRSTETRQVAYDFVKENYDALLKKLPAERF